MGVLCNQLPLGTQVDQSIGPIEFKIPYSLVLFEISGTEPAFMVECAIEMILNSTTIDVAGSLAFILIRDDNPTHQHFSLIPNIGSEDRLAENHCAAIVVNVIVRTAIERLAIEDCPRSIEFF